MDAFVKADSVINNPKYKNIACSVSGGADSDVMMDLVYKVNRGKNVNYIFFDTGLEYDATKRHLKYLEEKYNITIERIKPIKPIPKCVHEYGIPFLNKSCSEFLERLQKHDFDFPDTDDFSSIYPQYPKVKSALRWYCNSYSKDYLIQS